jgi:hypothetical protein
MFQWLHHVMLNCSYATRLTKPENRRCVELLHIDSSRDRVGLGTQRRTLLRSTEDINIIEYLTIIDY